MADGPHDHPQYATKEDLSAIDARLTNRLDANAELLRIIDEDLHDLDDRLTALEGTQPPTEPDPPVDPPTEPTDPVPEPSEWDFRTVVEAVDTETLVVFTAYAPVQGYSRSETLTILSGEMQIPFRRFRNQPLVRGTYALLMDGQHLTSVEVTEGQSSAFDFDTTDIPDGWHWFRIAGPPGTTSHRHAMAVKNGPWNQTFTPVESADFEIYAGHNPHVSGVIPFNATPRTLPLEPVPVTERHGPFSSTRLDELVVCRRGTIHRPNVNRDGIENTFNLQGYFWWTVASKYPELPLLDGPRGQGTVVMPTSMEMGHRGGAYGTDGWRHFHVGPDGEVRTLSGYRHRGKQAYWKDETEPELVGIWECPPGYHELWDARVDPDSVGTDPSVVVEGTDMPGHTQPPRWFLCDSQNNRVVIETHHDWRNHGPPTITEFLTGLIDPWSCPIRDEFIIIGERQGNRIAVWEKDSGKFVKWIVNVGPRPDLMKIQRSAYNAAKVSLETLRSFPVIWPEALDIYDDHLYIASAAQRQVRRVPLTAENATLDDMEILIPDHHHQGWLNMRVAQDDSAGQKGEIYTWNMYINEHGSPRVYSPDGKTYRGLWGSHPWDRTRLEYSSAGCVGNGRVITGGSNEGLVMVSEGAEDIDKDRAWAEEEEWNRRGYNVTHGRRGWGFHNQPLPRGQGFDYMLQAVGHWSFPSSRATASHNRSNS